MGRAGFDCCLNLTGEDIYERYVAQTGACWDFAKGRVKEAVVFHAGNRSGQRGAIKKD
jgi:hypothetical protein